MSKEEREIYLHQQKDERAQQNKKLKQEKKLRRKELLQKYSKKERQEYAKLCVEKDAEKMLKFQEKRELYLENHKKKQDEEQEREKNVKDAEMKRQQKVDKYLKGEYLFYKLFDTIEKRKLINFELYKDCNLLLPVYTEFKKLQSHSHHYLKSIPRRYILEKYFTTDKIEEIKQFEIFNAREIEEIVDIFTYRPATFGGCYLHH